MALECAFAGKMLGQKTFPIKCHPSKMKTFLDKQICDAKSAKKYLK